MNEQRLQDSRVLLGVSLMACTNILVIQNFKSLTHIRVDVSFTIEQSLSHAFVVFNLDLIRTETKVKRVF